LNGKNDVVGGLANIVATYMDGPSGYDSSPKWYHCTMVNFDILYFWIQIRISNQIRLMAPIFTGIINDFISALHKKKIL
jgi:hypothetical protein